MEDIMPPDPEPNNVPPASTPAPPASSVLELFLKKFPDPKVLRSEAIYLEPKVKNIAIGYNECPCTSANETRSHKR
jgi:hypothetical protein